MADEKATSVKRRPPAAKEGVRAVAFIPATRMELYRAAVVVAVAMWGLLIVAQAEILVVRDFWLDEICTLLLTTDPSLSHMLSALLHGADSNPPTLHLTLWTLHSIGIPLTETTLRLFSWLVVWGGLVGLYACLRTAFNKLPSAAGIAMVVAANLFTRQLFEARFYGPWFCICAWLCYALLRRRAGHGGWLNQALLALLSILMCTIHYFGVISFALIVTADLLADSGSIWRRVRARWPLGCAALVAPLLGYFYLHQSAALTAKTWVAPATLPRDLAFLHETLNAPALAGVAAILLLAWLLRGRIPLLQPPSSRPVRPLAGLFALAFLPIALVAFSYMAQSAEVSRYAFPALAGVAALTAWMCSRLHRWATLAIIGGLLVMGHGYLREQGVEAAYGTAEVRAMGILLEEKTAPTERIVCESRLDLYPLSVYFEKLRPRLYFLDFKTGEEPAEALTPSVDYCIVERDANRAVAAYYSQIQFCSHEVLAADTPFVLIAADEDIARIRLRFPHTKVQQRNGRLFELIPSDKP